MAHDVFISYASENGSIAQGACQAIERLDISCWIAPRNILPGSSYAEALIDAINQASIMVLIFSAHSNLSQHVLREVERAVSKGLTILPFKIDATVPSRDMEFYISSSHWLDASGLMKGKWQETLANAVSDQLAKARGRSTRGQAVRRESAPSSPVPSPAEPLPRPLAAAAPVAGAGGGWQLRSSSKSVLWLNIISERGRAFHFSLTDSKRGVIIGDDRVELQEETYNNLHRALADLTNPHHAADPAEFASLGGLLFRLVLPSNVQHALYHHDGPVSFATEELQLPWELLHDGHKFLCLNQPVARQPQTYRVADMLFGDETSASITPGGRVLIIADPAGDLPSAAGEAEELRGLFHRESAPCDTLIGPRECTYLSIMDRLSSGRYDLIHYSGHARTLPERQCSAIVLANQQLLMADEICRVLRGTPVAFLNACHSSTMDSSSGSAAGTSLSSAQNVRSLAQAFVHGNRSGRGRAVIGSMWWLNDDVARGLALTFYEHILRGQTLGEALRLARSKIQQEERDPALWSCYVLFGDPMLGWQRGGRPPSEAVRGPSTADAATATTTAVKENVVPVKAGEPVPSAVDAASMKTNGDEEQAFAPADQAGFFSELAEGPPWGDDTRVVLLAAVASMSMMNWSILSTVHLLLGFTYLDKGFLNAALKQRDLNPDSTRRALRQVLANSKRSKLSSDMVIGANLKAALSNAKSLARKAGDNEVREQHLLLGVLDVPGTGAAMLLEAIKIDVKALIASLRSADNSPPADPPSAAPIAATAAVPLGTSSFNEDGTINEQRFTPAAAASLQAATDIARESGWDELRGPHLFIGLLALSDCALARCLSKAGVPVAALASEITNRSRKGAAATRPPRLHREFFSDNALKVIARAAALADGNCPIGDEHLAAAILEDPKQFATRFLIANQFDPASLIRCLRGSAESGG